MAFINIGYLQSSGFYDFMLPFLLVTAITYSIFHSVKAKSKDFPLNNLAIAVVSVVIGLFATNNKPLRDFLFQWMPVFIILLLIIFLFLFIQKFFEGQQKDYLPLLIILILTLVIMGAYGIDNFTRLLGMDAENIIWAVGFIIFILILWSVYKMNSSAPKEPSTKNTPKI